MARSALPVGALTVLGTGLFGIGIAVGGYGAFVTALIERGVAADTAGFGMTIYLLGQVVAVLPADRFAGALVYPWLIGRSLRLTGSYTSGFLVMALSVGAVVVLLMLTIGVGALRTPSASDADVAGGGQ
jgi:DHA1 family inner membrane transport protein